jgi:lipoprotein-releasing system permease protein
LTPAFSAFLALRYLVSRWVNLLGVVGVAVAVWALIVVIAVFSGFIGEIREHMRSASPSLLVGGLPRDTSFSVLEPLLAADPDVVALAPRVRHYAMFFPHGRGSRVQSTKSLVTTPLAFDYVELLGIDPQAEFRTTELRSWLDAVRGSMIGVDDPEQPLAVRPELEEAWLAFSGQELPAGRLVTPSPGILFGPRRMDTGRLAPGQRVEVVSARFERGSDRPGLRMMRRTFAIAGAFETRHKAFDETAALCDLWVLRAMMGRIDDDPVSEVAIAVRPGASLAAVADRLTATCAAAGIPATVLTWEQQNRVFLDAVDQERGMMKLILFAVMLVAAFLIYATLNMMVTQKIKDIGILGALGATPAGTQSVFLAAGTAIATAGCTVGTLAGCCSAVYLNDVNDWTRRHFQIELFPTDLYALDRIPYRLEPAWIAQVVIGALIVALFATWLPARRAARMPPVRALAYE